MDPSTTDEPLYRHDCGECEFLGTYDGQDLYVCLGVHVVIARFGDRQGQYSSRDLRDMEDHPSLSNEHLTMAFTLARIKELT